MVSVPTIVPPVGACSDRVRLRGQKIGSTVTVMAGFAGSAATKVFEGLASSPDETFVLTRRLMADEHVTASQDGPGGSSSGSMIHEEVVQPQPDLSELASITTAAHLHACGRCGAFGNGHPGAEVTVTSQIRGVLGRGVVDPETGAARVQFRFALTDGEVLSGVQSICGLTSPPSQLPSPDAPQSTDRVLPAPAIREPLFACERAVFVEGVAEGATVRLFRDGREYASACFHYPALWLEFGDKLQPHETIWVDQGFPNCELGGAPSPAVEVKEADEIPPPIVLGGLCGGMTEIVVFQLRRNATVTLVQVNHPADPIQNGLQIGEIEAWDETCPVPLTSPLDPVRGKLVKAVQVLCDRTSPPSQPEDIKTRNIAKPVIVGPLVECSPMVRVRAIHPGARVEVYQTCANGGGWEMIAAEQVLSDSADLGVAPPLRSVPGESTVFVRQIACGNPVDGDRLPVDRIEGDLAPPVVGDCGDHLEVSPVLPGALVEVYTNGQYFRGGRSGGTTVYFDLPQPLPAGTTVKARQIMCERISDFSQELTIRDGVVKRRLAWVSTQRVSQLTGLLDSQRAGINDTDLGIVVDHDTGDGWLYFFFGDTNNHSASPKDYPPGWDSIGRTRARTAADIGATLEFLHDIEDGEPRPWIFGIHNVVQEYFEVPTGGFSHARRLYVFASTDHPKGPDNMGRSVLAGAYSAHDMFQVVPGHNDISNLKRDYLGEYKFINIAAQKIKNDEWPYLPENAEPGGEGVILIGSGRYRASQPCLAYVPLKPDQDPDFSEWRYLIGFAATTPDSGECGVPQWSPHQRDAIFLFDDSNSTFSNGHAGAVGELSIMYSAELRIWIMLYGGVALRSAEHPWGPWSAPIQVFDFGRDGGASFMHGASAYGPYIIARFTEFDRMSRELTIYYNMSTWDPYQVMLMRTVLRMDCSYDENFHCPTGGAVPEPPIPEGTEMPLPVPEGTGMPPPGFDASG